MTIPERLPKITSVEPQKKNQRRFNVYLDGEFAFGADEDLVVNRRLVIGKVIASEDMEKILFEAEVGKLMEKMYRWFSLRQHSEKEVRDYFKIKSQKLKVKNEEPVSSLVIDAVIETLRKKGLVNDLEFAKAWVQARRRSKQKSIKAIKVELFQKGIDKEMIEDVVRQQATGNSEEELAKQALEKKMKVWKNLDPKKKYQKLFEFLLRRGFEYDVVRKVLDKRTGNL